MTNKAIANVFNQLADYMELHNDNPYKIKSYQNAYLQLRKMPDPVGELSLSQLEGIKGIGKSLAARVHELVATGKLAALEALKAQTPDGVGNMLEIKGFGAKKVRILWKELGVETLGELLYACNENRLVSLKGFGTKTQEDLAQKIKYHLQSAGQHHYATMLPIAEHLQARIRTALPHAQVVFTGALRRQCNTLSHISLLVATDAPIAPIFEADFLQLQSAAPPQYNATTPDGKAVVVYQCAPNEFGSKQVRYTGSKVWLEAWQQAFPATDFKHLATEEAVFEKAGIPFIHPARRDDAQSIPQALAGYAPTLVATADLKGIVHAHTTYSDGMHTLSQMAHHTQSLGYTYLGITDHSKSAFYANGLSADRVREQWAEIDRLNQTLAPFKIFKGIEADILGDGSLDYDDDLLQGFDFVIASVHAHLKMNEAKATQRLIAAIQNPYTTILGHPTGRLLLSRQGYPIDYRAVIDACAAHKVAIELNANPYRLDLDWQWVGYAMEKGVKVAINPDAHSTSGITDVQYGVWSAQKGGLTTNMCLTALSVSEFADFLAYRKQAIFKL